MSYWVPRILVHCCGSIGSWVVEPGEKITNRFDSNEPPSPRNCRTVNLKWIWLFYIGRSSFRQSELPALISSKYPISSVLAKAPKIWKQLGRPEQERRGFCYLGFTSAAVDATYREERPANPLSFLPMGRDISRKSIVWSRSAGDWVQKKVVCMEMQRVGESAKQIQSRYPWKAAPRGEGWEGSTWTCSEKALN